MNILECTTESDINALNDVISQLGLSLYAAQGYTVENDGVIPVSAATGNQDTSAARLEKWAKPRQPQKPEFDLWYIPDPRDTYVDYVTEITAVMDGSGVTYVAKPLPPEWSYSEAEIQAYMEAAGNPG